MKRFLFFVDSLSTWVGKSFAWLILVLTLGVSYEVFVRYVLRAPTTWAFDFSYITYGAMFMMAGGQTPKTFCLTFAKPASLSKLRKRRAEQ